MSSTSTTVVTLKLTPEQFRTVRAEMEAMRDVLSDEQSEFDVGTEVWQGHAQRIMAIEQLLRVAL